MSTRIAYNETTAYGQMIAEDVYKRQMSTWASRDRCCSTAVVPQGIPHTLLLLATVS